MLRIALLLSGLGLSLGSPGANAADPKEADDLEKLQGNWKPLQCEYESSPQMTADIMKQVTGVFDKNEYFLYFVEPDRDGQPKVLRLARATFTLDMTTTPRSIIFEFADGPFKGQKRHGIYEIAGNQLKLCYGPTDKPKPTEFKAPPKSGYFLETWAKKVQ
jgi:uncharacterized protein (TIGR03067 family)